MRLRMVPCTFYAILFCEGPQTCDNFTVMTSSCNNFIGNRPDYGTSPFSQSAHTCVLVLRHLIESIMLQQCNYSSAT